MRLRVPFGEFTDEDGDSDADMKKELKEGFLQLDSALDVIPGKTARWLRLERFSTWFDEKVFGGRSKYTDEWESITKEGHFSEEIKHFRWRWKCMAAFNPCSAKMKGLRDYHKQVARGLTINKLFQMWSEEGRRLVSTRFELWWWTDKHWVNLYRAQCDPEKYKKLDREERKMEREAESGWFLDLSTLSIKEGYQIQEEASPEDGWDIEEWFRFYPEGIPPLNEDLFIFEAEMGHVWSEELLFEPRDRFRNWDNATFFWEYTWKSKMFLKTRNRRSACSCCDEY
jgi:hypothetical protein